MRFTIIRKADPATEAGKRATKELVAAMGAYHEEVARRGKLIDGNGLKPSAQGVRVRMRGGEVQVVDGPFAETKELVAGFSVIDAASKEEALAWMKRWPIEDANEESGRQVQLELRQLYHGSDFGGGPDAPEPPTPPRKPGTTRYLAMIKSDKATESGTFPDAACLAAMDALIADLAASGAMLGGQGLTPSSKNAARVVLTAERGQTTGPMKARVVDGPFAEAKEMIAGFTLLQAATIQEAVAFSKRWLKIHTAWSKVDGEIEIRPLYEAEDFAVE